MYCRSEKIHIGNIKKVGESKNVSPTFRAKKILAGDCFIKKTIQTTKKNINTVLSGTFLTTVFTAFSTKHFTKKDSEQNFEAKIKTLKKANGQPRFSANAKYEIIALKEAYKKNPNFTEYLLYLKESDNNTYRCNGFAIKNIVEAYALSPQSTFELLHEVNLDNEYKYKASDIAPLVYIEHEYPKIFQLIKDLEEDGTPRFQNYISDLHEAIKRNEDFALELILKKENNEYLYDASEINDLCYAASLDKKKTLELMQEKIQNKNRFNTRSILYLTGSSPNDYQKRLLELETIIGGKTVPLLGDSAIMGFSTTEETEFLKKVLDGDIEKDATIKHSKLKEREYMNIFSALKSEKINTEIILNKIFSSPNLFNVLKIITKENIKNNLNLLKNDKALYFLAQNIEDYSNAQINKPYFDDMYQLKTIIIENDTKFVKTIDFKLNNQNDIEIISQEKTRIGKNLINSEKELSNNTKIISDITIKNTEVRTIPTKKEQYIYKNNKLVSYESYTESLEHPAQFNINSNGKSFGLIKDYGTHKQGLKIDKQLVSPDGTKTEYCIIQGPRGSYLKYKIISPNGDVLLDIKRHNRKLNENHYITSINGQEYEIEFSENKIKVFKHDKNNKSKKYFVIDKAQFSPELFKTYKLLPGDQLFILGKTGCKILMTHEKKNKANAYYVDEDKEIKISKCLIDNVFTLLHEIGHLKDSDLGYISSDKTLKEIFNNELESFINNSTSKEHCLIEYFTRNDNMVDGFSEIVAETNSIISGTYNTCENTNLRAEILQEYFPKTIAYVANKLIQN